MKKKAKIKTKTKIVLIALFFLCSFFVFNIIRNNSLAADSDYDLKIIAIDPNSSSKVTGDAVLLDSNGDVMLMDTGNEDTTKSGTTYKNEVGDYVLSYLRNLKQQGKLKSFSMYFSHYHSDHYGLIAQSRETNATCSNGRGTYSDKSNSFIANLKSEFGTYINKIYVSDPSILIDSNNVKVGDPNGSTAYGTYYYARNNYEYLTYTFCQSGHTKESDCTGDVNNLCDSTGTKVQILKKGDNFSLGETNIKIIGPMRAYGSYITIDSYDDSTTLTDYNYELNNIDNGASLDYSIYNTGTYKWNHYLNDSSLVAMVTNKNTRYLSTGDIEWAEILALVNTGTDLKADILKIPHHGEKTGYYSRFYDRVKPKFTFYQQDSESLYGDNWSDKVIKEINKKYNVLATGYNGNIVYTIKDDKIDVKVESTSQTKTNNTKKITLTYKDKNTSSTLETHEFAMANGSKYYLENNTEYPIDNYTFSNFDSSLETTGTITSNINGNLLYTKNTHTVTFDSDGGSSVQKQTIEEGQTATVPTNPTKTGYNFTGWTLNGSLYNFNTPITHDITLKATWQIKTNTVTFNSNGGSSVSSQTVNYGSKVQQPTAPTKANQVFAGWTLNGSSYDFDAPVTSDITLDANWADQAFTVSFNSDGGSSVSSQTVTSGAKATKPTNPTKTGYTFNEWTLNGSTYNFNTAVTSDITLKATWNIKSYTVTFDSNGGSSVSSQTVNHGSKATQPTTPTKEGYTFAGWTLNDSPYDFNTSVTKNITLKATWNIKTYTITFDSAGGSSVSSQTIDYGGKVSIPTQPTKTGYSFTGWTLNGESYDFNTQVTSDLTLKATWTIKKYTVTFNSDGGSSVSSQTVNHGSKVTQPTAPTKEGYTFAGWTLNDSPYDFNTSVTKNITLKATWTIKKYVVTFDTDGGNDIPNQTINHGSKATQPANPEKEGYTFAGWTLDGETYDFNTSVTKNITVKANWVSGQYTITFDSDGGTSIPTQTVAYREKVQKPANPEKDGYVFDYWMLDNDQYNFNGRVTKDITLKAKWTKIKSIIIIKYIDASNNNNLIKTKTVTILEGETFNIDDYKDIIPEYKFSKVDTETKVDPETGKITIKLLYLSNNTTEVNVPDTNAKSKKVVLGLIVMIIGAFSAILGLKIRKNRN